MRRLLSFAFLGFCLAAILTVGCDSSPTPPPTVAVAQPTATIASTVASAPQPTLTVTNVISLPSFVIHLPIAAPVFYPTAAEWGNRINTLQQEQPQLAAYLNTLAELPTADAWVASAQLPMAAQELTLVAAVVPSEGVTLQTYLAAAQAELGQSRLALGTGVVVENATIRYDLHAAHTPLATLQYTLPATGKDVAGPIANYQAAMLNQTGTHLLLLTFVSQPGQPAAQEQIETILARLQDTTIDQ